MKRHTLLRDFSLQRWGCATLIGSEQSQATTAIQSHASKTHEATCPTHATLRPGEIECVALRLNNYKHQTTIHEFDQCAVFRYEAPALAGWRQAMLSSAMNRSLHLHDVRRTQIYFRSNATMGKSCGSLSRKKSARTRISFSHVIDNRVVVSKKFLAEKVLKVLYYLQDKLTQSKKGGGTPLIT